MNKHWTISSFCINAHKSLTCYTSGYPGPRCRLGVSLSPWSLHTLTHSISDCHQSIPDIKYNLYHLKNEHENMFLSDFLRLPKYIKQHCFYITQKRPIVSSYLCVYIVLICLLLTGETSQKKSENSSMGILVIRTHHFIQHWKALWLTLLCLL